MRRRGLPTGWRSWRTQAIDPGRVDGNGLPPLAQEQGRAKDGAPSGLTGEHWVDKRFLLARPVALAFPGKSTRDEGAGM
jgi:hypothetical protein